MTVIMLALTISVNFIFHAHRHQSAVASRTKKGAMVFDAVPRRNEMSTGTMKSGPIVRSRLFESSYWRTHLHPRRDEVPRQCDRLASTCPAARETALDPPRKGVKKSNFLGDDPATRLRGV